MSVTEFYVKAKAGVLYWKLSIIRCLIYGSMVAWGMFISGTEGFTSLNDMTWLQIIRLGGNMVFAGMGGVVLAFLDQTLSKLGAQVPPNNQEPKQGP